jgi:hypothetical protein
MAHASATGSAAANNNSIATVNDNNSSSNASGAGSSAANYGVTATTTYSVHNSDLMCSVTGNAYGYAEAQSGMCCGTNNLTESFNGTAGVNQTIQNVGANALTQQQVSFQGNVNLTP